MMKRFCFSGQHPLLVLEYNYKPTALQAHNTFKQDIAIVSEGIKGEIDFKHEQH